jgi:hypothetical protein
MSLGKLTTEQRTTRESQTSRNGAGVSLRTWKVAVLPGDGIGPDVMAEGLKVLAVVESLLTGVSFKLSEHPVGAAEYLRNGNPLPG